MVKLNWRGIWHWFADPVPTPTWAILALGALCLWFVCADLRHKTPIQPHIITDREAKNLECLARAIPDMQRDIQQIRENTTPQEGALPAIGGMRQ